MIDNIIIVKVIAAIENLYNQKVVSTQIQVQKTRPEFEGDVTVVVFPFLCYSHKSAELTATEIGNYLKQELPIIATFNIIKGFLNLVISNKYLIDFFKENATNPDYGKYPIKDEKPVVIEYSSPNTNKPLHLGHVRNNLLGRSIANILKASGKKVYQVNLINDRGIHICKSMIAWQKWGEGETPEKSNIKGDKFVGNFYVKFDKEYKKEIAELVASGIDKDEAARNAPLMCEAKTMLRKWENGDAQVHKLWKKMNTWVYKGFDITYRRMGINFDKVYFESETYLSGKKLVEEGMESGVFYQKDDSSVWCDLRDEGLDEKLLLRADGTSVYITQDIGTAQLRNDDYHPQKLIYVVGNEQIYHFDVLKRILKKLGRNWSDNIFHMSYGMVELPHGKMKSREGTVVDADDLMDEMIETARQKSEELGKFDDFGKEESMALYEMIGLGALKYFILKVDPKKTMLFNPVESIDFNGNTGPFIQYTHARICSVLRKANEQQIKYNISKLNLKELLAKEKSLIRILYDFPQMIQLAAQMYSPSQIANYAFELAKEYNQFYHEHSILKETDPQKRQLRLGLSVFTGNTLRSAMGLLGIGVPERM